MSSGIYRLLSFVSANRRSYLNPSQEQQQAAAGMYEPSVLLIVAGGTICMQVSYIPILFGGKRTEWILIWDGIGLRRRPRNLQTLP